MTKKKWTLTPEKRKQIEAVMPAVLEMLMKIHGVSEKKD